MMWLQKAAAVLAGGMFIGVGINLFLIPHLLMDGGMIGIGLLAKYLFQWPPGLFMIICSLPLFALVFVYDRYLFYRSFHGMLIETCIIDLFAPMRAWNLWTLPTSAVVGGLMIGVGTGLLLAFQTNTGGTDMLAQFLARRTPIPVALYIFIIDGFIVWASLPVIGWERAVFSLFTIVAVAVSTHFVYNYWRQSPPYVVIGPLSREAGQRWRN
ncbi:YitT family protein [Brevibacillus composti]|uniref:YitT family protein n=1 Tax=Brevibacillus composti TaxID=2796470 RepID=A0A7T5JPU9_9BACL|nr:YitT family protein [Brevibacillus composti]QQE75674.1 YitT family protein [Brevibacillus composti]QUO42700.1 YitT family protein [Brevibacillus composti]